MQNEKETKIAEFQAFRVFSISRIKSLNVKEWAKQISESIR